MSSRKELLAKCEELKIKNYKSKNKDELIELINNLTISSSTTTSKDKPENKRLDLLDEVLKEHSIKSLAKVLNVAHGTISRWKELNDIPSSYEFDLLKILNIDIDYSKYTSKEKDQFFTPVETAKYCYDIFLNKIKNELKIEGENDFTYIEPSAGDGSFLKVLPKNRTIAFDIEPRHKDIKIQDFLSWNPENKYKNIVVFGNPPFGLRGNLALRFINHASKFADFVCFILPQLFESDGKGVPRKRVENLNLIHSEKIQTKFYEPEDGNRTQGTGKKEVEVNTIFQIWAKKHSNSDYDLKEPDNKVVTVYSLSDGGTPSSTRNKKMLDCCDLYLPSTCFGKENMKIYTSFEDLPGRKGYGLVFNENKEQNIKKCKELIWNEIAFLSTNSAYNLRSSQIYNLF